MQWMIERDVEEIDDRATMELTVSGVRLAGGGGRNRLGPRPELSVVEDPRTIVCVSHCDNGITKRGEK